MDEATPPSGSNTYKVVVVSSDDALGATTDGMPPATDNLPKESYHKVTVEVTDEDEDGSVSLSTLQPQAGTALNINGTADDADDDAAATLKDQDASDHPNRPPRSGSGSSPRPWTAPGP